MKNLVIFGALLFIGLSACTKETLFTKDEWLVGNENSSVTKEINSLGNELTVNLESNSFCVGASGIEVVIESKGDVLYSEKVESFPYTKKILLPGDPKLTITTKVYDLVNPSVQCVWLGNAICKIQY